MHPRLSFVFLTAMALTACGPWPDVPVAAGSSNKGSQYPLFVPLDKSNPPTPDQQAEERDAEAALAARIARLRARAADLRRLPVE